MYWWYFFLYLAKALSVVFLSILAIITTSFLFLVYLNFIVGYFGTTVGLFLGAVTIPLCGLVLLCILYAREKADLKRD